MPDNVEIILDHIKELRADNINNARTLGEMLAEIRNLRSDVKDLREENDKLHRRIDKKDERIRELEHKVNADEQAFARLEERIDTTSNNNKWWVSIGVAIATAFATAAAVVTQIVMSK